MRACTKKERLKLIGENQVEAKKRIADVQKRMGDLKTDDWRANLREKQQKQSEG